MRIRLLVTSLPVWQEGKVHIKVFLKGNETELGSASFRVVYLPYKESDATAI